MRTTAISFLLISSLLGALALPRAATAKPPAPPRTVMCIPGDLLFSEDFHPETVSDRWWFKADFALRDGGLLRTDVHPSETRRVFLKDASFHNTVIQFSFRLAGKTTDLRLVTGSGGGYNSVTHIRPGHFQVHTPVDRNAGIVPAQLGECSRPPRPGQWQTMTVEYWGDEIIAHLSDNEFILGKHPIIDRTRTYFAFQFDLPGASIDNVHVWKASGQHRNWTGTRSRLAMAQADRDPVNRNPEERYRIEYMNIRSRLTLHDPAYRDLVATHDRLQAALHADYADAFITHKQIGKLIAKKKQLLRANIPAFKLMETEVHRASRDEDDYVLSTKPALARLQEDGIPRQRFASELGQVRARLEAAGDKQLAALVAETARRQAALEARFPEAFVSVDTAVERRQAVRTMLNDNPEFQVRNRVVVDALQAIKGYEHQAAPDLARLAAAARTYSESLKSSNTP